MSSDLLRRAAFELRATAHFVTVREEWDDTYGPDGSREDIPPDDRRWIGLMRAELAEPLAAWLEAMANSLYDEGEAFATEALALARVILGEAPDEH